MRRRFVLGVKEVSWSASDKTQTETSVTVVIEGVEGEIFAKILDSVVVAK